MILVDDLKLLHKVNEFIVNKKTSKLKDQINIRKLSYD